MTNNRTASITLSGLLPNTKYIYEFLGAGANWPTILNNSSGIIFTNNATTKTIKTNVKFCFGTGVCPSDSPEVLDYTVDSCSNLSGLYTNLNFILKDFDTKQELYNDIIEVTCSGCIPRLDISLPNSVSITNSNTYPISAVVSGLIPKQTYNYSFTGVDSNWPSTITNISGSFIAKDDTEIINSSLTFCPATGLCESYQKTVLPYSLDQDCLVGTTNPYSRIRFTVNPLSCGMDSVTTDSLTVNCINCLPRLSISSPADVTLSTTNQNLYTVSHVVSGLKTNETYNYVYEGQQSNWPTVINPISGSFVASSTTKNLSATLMFCSPKSICPSGTLGLINYTLDSAPIKLVKQNKLSTGITLKVSPVSCNIPSKTSNVFTLTCNGCLPCFSYSTLSFADGPELSLSNSCCTGIKAITVNVSGAVPGDAYSYSFNSESSDILFTPTTGTVYFGGSGIGIINSIMSVNLVQSQQVVANCELTHNDTQIKTTDFLVIKCSGACNT